MASSPQIAVKVENVVAELTDIRRGVAAVQEEIAKMYLAGPWSGAAAEFHQRVKDALGDAETSSHTLIGNLNLLEAKVRAAVEAMSNHDEAAQAMFAVLDATAPAPTTPPTTPTTTPSAATGFGA